MFDFKVEQAIEPSSLMEQRESAVTTLIRNSLTHPGESGTADEGADACGHRNRKEGSRRPRRQDRWPEPAEAAEGTRGEWPDRTRTAHGHA